MYKILYRSMFIVLLIVSLFYLGFGFSSYVDAQNQLLSGSPPSEMINPEKMDADPYMADQFRIQPLAPTDDLDVLWETGLYVQIAQGIVTFSFALATAIFAIFALTNRQRFAILAVIFLPITYLADEIFSFVRLGIYGIGTYNVYIFNILEVILLVTLLAMCVFTIRHFYHSAHAEQPKGGAGL